MTEEELLGHKKVRELRQVLTDLSLVSHVSGAPIDSSGGGSGPGDKSGARPPGEVDWKGDKEPDFRQKSHVHFVRRLSALSRGLHKLSDERAELILDEILKDAKDALHAWQKSPVPAGTDPSPGTRAWKIQIANDTRSSRVVAGHFGISHVSVIRYREQYSGVTE